MAASIGVGESTLRRYLADPRFPYPRGPWSKAQIAEIKQWAANYLQEDRSGKAEKTEANSDLARAGKLIDIQLKTERRAKLIAERFVIERKYVARAEHEVATAKKFEAIKKALQQLPNAIGQRLHDAPSVQDLKNILNEALRNLMNVGFGGAAMANNPADANSDRKPEVRDA